MMPEKVEKWPIDRLIPFAGNARTHSESQVGKVAASMKEFGFTSPILVDGKDGIIAGHCRLMAARKLGLAEVPVIVLDHLSDAQRRAYILADNKLALDAGWDSELLEAALIALSEDGFDLELTGFAPGELDLLSEEVSAELPSWGSAKATEQPRAKGDVLQVAEIVLSGPVTAEDAEKLRAEYYGRGIKVSFRG
ncbi:MAG: ParB N-terminal domain-containing protein [Magnetococcales bacterium]|nr:ParB N-terminal domain-containing protein [Magnetococcales bacterium]